MLRLLCLGWAVLSLACCAPAQENPFLGRWALTSEGGGPGWLEVVQKEGVFSGALLWIGGSPEPQSRIYFDGNTLYALRIREDEIRDASGKVLRTQIHPITLSATITGEELRGTLTEPGSDSLSVIRQAFTGRRIPPIPPAPDLEKLRFGDPIVLFNGRDLDGWNPKGGAYWGAIARGADREDTQGWIALDPTAVNGWFVRDGVLVNDPVQHADQPFIRYANLHTVQAFRDFNLTLDVKVPADGNSGIYLRGLYEVQLRDSFGQPLDCHNMGAIYGRITPAAPAETPAGAWQTLDITLVQRHATIKLNGKTIIDNQPIAGCTGGALTSDESLPGPIYIQGDHTGVELLNIVLRPVL
ncbi:MAG: DUF1080 domain-containing protein [Candidatus Hydrogenedentes bacterium]|nr:DUF1080 domain-containing protein [Candidatus Hydrogenedentota bacterium]